MGQMKKHPKKLAVSAKTQNAKNLGMCLDNLNDFGKMSNNKIWQNYDIKKACQNAVIDLVCTYIIKVNGKGLFYYRKKTN
jgi:hypothetical protein